MDELMLLERCELFSEFAPEDLRHVIAHVKSVDVERNEVLFREGETAKDLYLVSSGRVAIGRQSPEGRESLVALMETGDLFGEMALLDGEPRSASARALEPSTLLVIPYSAVLTELERRPELLWVLVRLVAKRLRATDSALADAVFLDVPGRTAKRLLELAGDADDFTLPITQEELAGLVGASRERVNKAIAAFCRLGWIDQFDRRYRIIERDRLAQRAR